MTREHTSWLRESLGGTMLKTGLTFASALVALTLTGSPALADTEGEKKKNDKEWKELEQQQKGDLQKKENPLKKVLELLKDIEDRLVDADTGDWTQDEQRQVVEALKLQDDAKSALDKLIEQIENMQNSGGSGSGQQQDNPQQGGGQGKDQQQQSEGKETPEQKRERERREQQRQQREKEQQRQQELEQQLEQASGKKPQEKKEDKTGEGKKPKDGKEDKRQQEKEKGSLPPDDSGALRDREGRTQPWGNLPLKLHQDVEKARREAIPERFRDMIHGYRKRINED